MIQCFKILFLSISILFSFGVTTNQAVCDLEMKVKKLCCVSKKSCCDANKDIESENNCNKDCCLASNNMLCHAKTSSGLCLITKETNAIHQRHTQRLMKRIKRFGKYICIFTQNTKDESCNHFFSDIWLDTWH